MKNEKPYVASCMTPKPINNIGVTVGLFIGGVIFTGAGADTIATSNIWVGLAIAVAGLTMIFLVKKRVN